MTPITLSISADVIDEYAAVRVGALPVQLLAAASTSLGACIQLQSAAEQQLASTGLTPATLTDDPRIRACRTAASASGLKPSTFRSSPEQLARRLLKGQGLTTPLPPVTAYCLISAKHLAPLGAYDVSRLPGNTITLRHCNPARDRFTPLSGNADRFPLTERVVVYASGDEIICWSFNHRDSSNTCLTHSTTDALFVGEAIDSVQHEPLERAMTELEQLLADHGAKPGEVQFADTSTPQITID